MFRLSVRCTFSPCDKKRTRKGFSHNFNHAVLRNVELLFDSIEGSSVFLHAMRMSRSRSSCFKFIVFLFFLHFLLQYLTDSQSLSHFFRHVKGRRQKQHIFLLEDVAFSFWRCRNEWLKYETDRIDTMSCVCS